MANENSNHNRKIVLAIFVGVVVWFGYAAWSDSSRNSEIEITQDPARLAYLVLDYRDKDYKSSATESGNEITVKFNLGKYSAGSEITFLDEARYVYEKFFNNFKSKNITIVGEATFRDIKGNESDGKAFQIKFTPSQASSINWKNVQYLDLPRLAQEYWKAPE
jgi:hypothetical protein